ncbi:N-acetylmuramoyl-L-alanine amidase [Methylopila sp. M107]|uniref:N-acetylmuramoyl-L-alanine amidase n=1 Tax=Methylopila sp. M107 TaxID=1101190 RepID=UPI00037499BD|nr:N-acetylmuramoyl-L-alanine amidase [Methylopila sp. M107]
MPNRRPSRGAWLAAGICLAAAAAPTGSRACEKGSFTVLLDVGHSPSAPGAISARGKTEYAFNVALAAAIERAVASKGFAVDRLGAAASAARAVRRAGAIKRSGADLLLSVHHDSAQPRYFETWTYQGEQRAYSDRFKGWSLFVSQSGTHARESLRFARLLGDRLKSRGWPFTRHHAEPILGEGRALIDPSRGVYRRDDLAVLRSAPAPAALLEAGVIVNRDEEAALDTGSRRSAIAEAVAEAVDAFCAGE